MMLRFLPVPELVIVFALANLIVGPGTMWRLMRARHRGRIGPRGGRVKQPGTRGN